MSEKLKRGISLVGAEAQALVPIQPIKIKTLRFLGVRVPAEKPEEIKLKIPDSVQITPETAKKLKEARQIMGGRLIMPDAVESALGTRIDLRYVNDFPFSEEQLKILNHDSVIMYFADETEKGAPITMQKLKALKHSRTRRMLSALKIGAGESLMGRKKIARYLENVAESYRNSDPFAKSEGEAYYDRETSRPGWRAVTQRTLPGTHFTDMLGQLRKICEHIQTLSSNGFKFSDRADSAIRDFKYQEEALSHLVPFYPDEAARRLTELDLAQLTLLRPVEAAYLSSVLMANTERKLLKDEFTSTCVTSAKFNREIINIGNTDVESDGPIKISGIRPDKKYFLHGAVLSLGADALPTLPQPEEPTVSAIEVKKPLLIPFITDMKEIQGPSDLPFDPERDISDPEFKQMVEYLRNKSLDGIHLDMATYMKIFAPQRMIDQLGYIFPPLVILEDAIAYRNNHIKWHKQALSEGVGDDLSGSREIASHTSKMKILFPELYNKSKFKFKLSYFEHKRLESDLNRLVKNGTMINHLDFFYHMNILYPDSVRKRYGSLLNRELIDQTYQVGKPEKNAELYLETEAYFKILSPNYDGKVDWDRVKLAINEAREKGEYEKLAQMAAHATILAAHEVKVTDKGFEITMRKPEKKSAPAILTDRKSDTEPFFDPERDIADSERMGMFNEMGDLRVNSSSKLSSQTNLSGLPINTHIEYVTAALSLRRLFPQNFQAFEKADLPNRDHYFRLLYHVEDSAKRLDDNYNIGDSPVREAIESAMLIREFFPKKWNTGLEEHKDLMERLVQKAISSGRPEDNIRTLAELNIIFPNLITQNYGEHFTPEMMRARYAKASEDQNVLYFLKDEAAYRIITGKKCPFVNGRKIKEVIEWSREKNKYGYLSLIYESLLISTAGEVRVTDQGLVVNAKKPVKQETAPRLPQWTF